jgi:hypothetical protein
MSRVAVGVIALSVASACGGAPNLTKATSTYALAARAATDELTVSVRVVTDLCHHSMDLQYFVARMLPSSTVANLEKYADTPFANAANIGTITWKQRCEGLARAELAFTNGVAVIARYADALAAFAGKEPTPDKDVQALAKAAADDVAALSPAAADYQQTLEGIGGPLAAVAKVTEGAWKAKQLEAVTATTDGPLHTVLGKLEDFVHVARKRHVHDARQALADAVMQLDDASTDVRLKLSATRLDIEETERLNALEERIVIMSQILHELEDAHRRLVQGWQQGEKASGSATARAMVTFARELDEELRRLHMTEAVR